MVNLVSLRIVVNSALNLVDLVVVRLIAGISNRTFFLIHNSSFTHTGTHSLDLFSIAIFPLTNTKTHIFIPPSLLINTNTLLILTLTSFTLSHTHYLFLSYNYFPFLSFSISLSIFLSRTHTKKNKKKQNKVFEAMHMEF